MSRRVLFLGFLLASLVSASAAPPAWWASRGATDANPPNDDAAVNQGQLKQFTRKAVQELNARIPSGAGADLNGLVNGWGQAYQTGGHNAANPLPTDFEAMNSGQLKWIANKVHARLVFAKYEDAVPAWLVQNPATDTQLVNLGQLKTVFNFDLNAPTGQLPGWWQKFYFNGQTGIDPNGDPDSDSSTNLQEFQNGTNPQVPNIPVPNIPVDSDSDGLPDAEDADPNDSVVDWAPAAEATYAVIEMEQVNFAGYPFPAQLNPLNYWTHTRASIGKGGTVLWQYPVKSTNAAGDEWNDRYRVWKNGAWSADITNQSTEFTSFNMSTFYPSTIDTWNPSIRTQVNVTVDCVAFIPHAVCGDLILGLGDYGGSQGRLPVCYTDSDANPPTAETRNDGYASTGATHVATLWTLGAESITANPIDPPGSVELMSFYYFGSSAPLMGIMNYRPVASPGGALAILGTQTTAGVGLWKIWNGPDHGGPQVPGQGSPTVINAGAWPHDDLLLIRAIEDGGVTVGERYGVGVSGGLWHPVVNDHGSESELPGTEGITHSALAICRVPTGVSGQSRLVAAGTDLWVQKNGQWSTAAYKPSANTIIAVSKNGVLLGTQAIWRNGKEISLDSLVANHKVAGSASSARYTNLLGYAMNGEGAIVALADDALHPGSGKKTLLTLLPVEVIEVSPKTKDENDVDIAGSEKPSTSTPLTPFVELNPVADKIAHRELKVRIGEALKGKTVTWTLEPVPGATPATIRGAWTNSTTHPNRFEASAAYGANGFTLLSQASGKTTVANDGFTAIRVNVPPIGFNQARIKIQVEGTTAPIDLIDMEVPGVVVIDPGHGGTTNVSGSSSNNAVSPSGVLEKTMTLDYGLALRDSLRARRQQDKLNLRVFMTRKTDDENPTGADRGHKARDNGADVLFVLHFNSDDDSGTTAHPRVPHRSRGTLEVYRTDSNVSPQEDTDLSSNLIDRMVAAMTPLDAGANHRTRVAYGGNGVGGPAVSSDIYNGNTETYHPIRTAYIEGEFIDFGANTAANHTDDAVDILLNTGPNAPTVKTAITDAIRDGILQNIRDQP